MATAKFRRTRSVSLSGEVEFLRCRSSDNDVSNYSTQIRASRKSSDFCVTRERLTGLPARPEFIRAFSSNCVENGRSNSIVTKSDRDAIRATLCLPGNNSVLNINNIPEECLECIFSFLTLTERGNAAQVCTYWQRIMQSPSLWSVVDLSSLPACTNKLKLHQCTYLCYDQYRHRMRAFLEHLIRIRPVFRSLKFALDIEDPVDGYRCLLTDLVRVSRCQEMRVAELVWTETPAKRPFAWQSVSATWSTSDIRDLMFRRHHRQRHFVRFFDLFIASVPNLTVLSLPFDWSERSLVVLQRLQNLCDVTLRKYFRYAAVSPELFASSFESLPNLRRLSIELWTESSGGFSYFQLKSASLEHLDVSACRGIFLNEVSLPCLMSFQMSRSPLIQTLDGGIWVSGPKDTPCVHEVLRSGAPMLQQLNSYNLPTDWRENVFEDGLQQTLAAVCSCSEHKPSTSAGDVP